MKNSCSRPLALLFALAVLGTAIPTPTLAQGQPAQTTLAEVLAKLAADPTTPDQYHAQVRLHVRMRMFPWISITVNGDSAYKRPGLYHFVFKGVPKAAEHFSDLAYDLGNAATWPQKYEIALLSSGSKDTEPVIRLTPRKRGMVKNLDVSVDMNKGHIDKAVWNRFDGGVISLVQHYNAIGNHEMVAEQDATINIPRMKAELSAQYTGFDLGTAVEQNRH
ncbi:MAG: hypothetical protein ABR584_07625 [Candidatus Baltobacteraceae bacterium]